MAYQVALVVVERTGSGAEDAAAVANLVGIAKACSSQLCSLVDWTESNGKRAECELLWTLFDDDPTQFVLITGFGNAAHFRDQRPCGSYGRS
jgi:hypothetical protein